MRIAPDHPRLRIVAIACWAFAALLIVQAPHVAPFAQRELLAAFVFVAAALIFAIGISFWLLGTDRRAGVILDSKGVMLNLGHSASFVGWENIAEIGISHRRSTIFALGSRAQLGIRLYDPAAYLQSYEARIPSGRGIFAQLVRFLQRRIPRDRQEYTPTLADLAQHRQQTGYDLLVPEALLGGRASAFVDLIETYRTNPRERQTLQA